MVALDTGMAAGADGLEFDVQLSSDGIPVVIHDSTLDRTTDQTGPVSAMTADQLARVDAGYRFEKDGAFPFRGQGIGVPRLDHVLARHGNARIIIELKGASADLARAVGAVVRKAGLAERCCIGSFHALTIHTVRSEFTEIATSASQPEARRALHRSWVRWPFHSPQPYCAFQLPEFAGRLRVVSRNFLSYVHAEGRLVQVWVVNEQAHVLRLLDWGADGIISDRPDIAVAARDEWVASRT